MHRPKIRRIKEKSILRKSIEETEKDLLDLWET